MEAVIDSRYRLIRSIGKGASGEVFVAEDGLVKRIVAIKIYNVTDTSSMKYFDSESRAVTRLSHPNIVEVYDIVSRDKYKYIVMEYVNGITLQEYAEKKKILGIDEAVGCIEQVLSALSEAHANGIVHRDIKPENILIDKNGNVKLTDFGISKTMENDNFNRENVGIGSVYYISPEQASGGRIDLRSDLYSLGVVMYQLLCGRVPFDADSKSAIAMMHITDMPTPPREINPNIPKKLEEVIMRALQKDLKTRYASAKEMRQALLASVGIKREDRRGRIKNAAGVAGTVLLCAGLLAAFVGLAVIFAIKANAGADIHNGATNIMCKAASMFVLYRA